MSEQRIVEVSGLGEGDDPVIALSDALSQAQAGLIAAKVGPQFLRKMTWAAPDPANVHPNRRNVDRALREVFGGFRAPVTVLASPDEYVHVTLEAAPPDGPPSSDPIWQGYDVMGLARQMAARSQVPDMIALFRQWSRDGAAARAELGGLDIAYGPARDHTLDLYRPAGVEKPPVWVFIHGGYWQASTKDQHPQFCRAMIANGFAVANLDYRLSPETPLTDIVKDIRMALNFLVREADNLSIDAGNMHVCGHSAGGHLSAYAVTDADCPPLRSALLLSGIFDLEAVRLIPMGRVLGLSTRAMSRRLSPITRTPVGAPRIRVALGALESDEFKRQAAELAEKWGAPAPLELNGANHFSLLDGLNGGPLFDLALEAAAC